MKKWPLRYARRLHLSFILILLIPLLVSLILYAYMLNLTNEQSDRLHESLLAKVQADMDARLLSVRSVGSRLYIDSDLRTLSNVKGGFQPNYAMAQVRLFQELNSQVLSNDELSGLFVYFPQSHKVISTNGNMDFSMYYSLYYDETGLEEQELEKLISGEHRYDLRILNAKGHTKQMIMLLSLPSDSDRRPVSVIGMILSADMLKKQMALNEFSDTATRLFLCTEGGDLFSPLSEVATAEGIPDGDVSGATVRFEDEAVRASARTSAQSNIRYLMITPVTRIHEDVLRSRIVIVAGTLLILLSGLILSRHLTERNYDPVDQLLRTIRSGTMEDSGSGMDELVWANREVEQLYKNSINNEQLLRDSRRQMRDYILLQLLTRGYVDRPELSGLPAEDSCFCVVILKVLQSSELKETELALRTSILRNLIEENINTRYPVRTLEWGEETISLIAIKKMESDPISAIREAAEKVQTTTESSLHFSCAAFIGPVANSVAEIPKAYRSTKELEEYSAILDSDLISFSDIRDLGTQYDFTLDDEDRLKNAVSVGEEETAGELMKAIFERNRKTGISVDLYRCLAYTMAGVLLRGANSGGIRNASVNEKLSAALANNKPGVDLENAFSEIMKEICREVCEERQNTEGDRAFCMEVDTFVRDHFTDPDLNISYVSQHFDLTPAYLSTRYKRETGKSLLELINTSRLDWAEELLRNGVTVADAAERSGFRDSGSLIRAFKKKKGITPGQVKQQNG